MAHLTVRFNAFIESILRVPPIFLLDEVLKSGFTFPFHYWNDTVADNGYDASSASPNHIWGSVLFSACYALFTFSVSIIVCGLTLMIAVLNIRQLIIVYFYLISILMVYFSYQQNVKFIEYVMATDGLHIAPHDELFYSLGTAFIRTVAIQCTIGFLYQYLNPAVLRYRWLPKAVLASFLAPSFISFVPLPTLVLQSLPFYTILLPIAISKYVFWSNIPYVFEYLVSAWRYSRNFVIGFGLPALLETEWSKLRVPVVLRIYWFIRLLDNTTTYIMQNSLLKNLNATVETNETISYQSNRNEYFIIGVPTLLQMVKSLLISGCESFVGVLGMASFVSYICQQIGYFFQSILLIEDEDKNFGTISGILFCILALQTGLTGLTPQKRFVRLCRNVCLLCTALLHIIHSILNPLLMTLSASHNPAKNRHARALLVSGFLIVYPTSLLIYLWKTDSISTWLLAVTAFSIEVIVKMTVTLIIYVLFLYDYYRETFWEELDDYVYYIRSFGNTIEFCFGIFLFFNGAWILLYESGGTLRAAMMCIHAYFNIWCEAKTGWSVFIKRRTAVQKIDTLPDADCDELDELYDVCSICYQQMRTAKITTCKHYFHAVCLRKWLYMQDYCPICHSILYKQDDHKRKKQLRSLRYRQVDPPNEPAFINEEFPDINLAELNGLEVDEN